MRSVPVFGRVTLCPHCPSQLSSPHDALALYAKLVHVAAPPCLRSLTLLARQAAQPVGRVGAPSLRSSYLVPGWR